MRKSFAALLLTGALTTFVSCKDDVSNSENSINPDLEGRGYIGFSIKTDLTTRAEDQNVTIGDRDETFNEGDEYEYKLVDNAKAHWVIFFDNRENFYGISNLEGYSIDDTNFGGHESHDNYPEQVVAKFVKSSDSTSEEDLPSYAMVLVNVNPNKFTSLANQLSGKTINQVAQLLATPINNDEYRNSEKIGQYEYNNNTYFTMTSSSFFTPTGEPAHVTKLNLSQVYPTPQEAYENRTTVYVERMVAKHSLNFANGEESGNGYIYVPSVTNADSYTKVALVANYDGSPFTPVSQDWHVYVNGWGMNGVEPNTFVFKNLFPASKLATSYSTWGVPTSWLDNGGSTGGLDPFFTYWNFDALHRSYWAVDQHYYDDSEHTFANAYDATYNVRSQHNYPDQYRHPLYDDATGADKDGEDRDNGMTVRTSLNYMSYNNLMGFGYNTPHRYTLENTFSYEEALQEYAPLRYGTHVILTAELLFDGETPGNASTKLSAYGYFFGNDESYIRFAFRQWCEDAFYDYAVLNYAGQPIDVAHAEDYFELVPAYTVHGDGKMILSLKSDKDYSQFSYTINNETGRFGSAEELRKEIYIHTEPVKYYKNGMMYYAVPVQHRMGRSNDPNYPLVQLGRGDNYTYNIGQFGVVRNHWYEFHINGVGNIGSPVQDPEQPIIPDPEEEYYLSFDVVVIPWHKIFQDDIVLQ